MRTKSGFHKPIQRVALSVAGIMVLPFVAAAQQNEVSITEQDEYRVITSNGIPDHPTGSFPNRNNPNQISTQRHNFKVPLNPEAADTATSLGLWPFGVAINGIPFDPGAAEFWNRDFNSGWQYEALGGGVNLGVDGSNAHVQPNGAYHYHGLPSALIKNHGDEASPVLVGYAADGFPMYNQYCGVDDASEKMYASYTIKSGQRSGGPGGRHTGEFIQDYAFKPGLGTLDELNGHDTPTTEYPDGIYHYHLTETFPYIPREFHGTPDSSFMRGGPGGPGGRRGPGGGQRRGPGGPQGGQFDGRPPHHFPSPPPNHGQFQNSGDQYGGPDRFSRESSYDVSRNAPQNGQQFGGPPPDQSYDRPPRGGYGEPQNEQYRDSGHTPEGDYYAPQQPQRYGPPRDMPPRDSNDRSQERGFNGPPDQQYGRPDNNPQRGGFNGPRDKQQYRQVEGPRRERVSQFAGPGWQPDGRYIGPGGPPPRSRMGGQDRFGQQRGRQGDQFGEPPNRQQYGPPQDGPGGQRLDGPPKGNRQQGPGRPPQGQFDGSRGRQFRGPQGGPQGQRFGGPPQGNGQQGPARPPRGRYNGEQDGRFNSPPPQGNYDGPQEGPPPPPDEFEDSYPPQPSDSPPYK